MQLYKEHIYIDSPRNWYEGADLNYQLTIVLRIYVANRLEMILSDYNNSYSFQD